MQVKALKVPLIGFGGVATGISVGTLSAEYISRVSGQTGWNSTGVKAGVKGAIGLAAYLGSQKMTSGQAEAAFFLEMLAYGSWGSIIVDLVAQLYTGGFAGMAESWAVTTRSMAMGARKMSMGLKSLEQRRLPPNQPISQVQGQASSIF